MNDTAPELEFVEQMREDARLVDQRLEEWWGAAKTGSTRLHEAMGYSLLGGGKRLRPLLCLWSSDAAGGARGEALWRAAMAVEMIHSYSLIHDDLPAMDDDDLRRGRPSCHRQFDDATAILAGDALQSEAFLQLSGIDDALLARDLGRILASASGLTGMVAGQQLDLESTGAVSPAGWERIETLHRYKTGRLLGAALAMGARAAGVRGTRLATAQTAGESAGLAFQIADDILDETQSSKALGKSAGKDRIQGKATAVRALGSVKLARKKADQLLGHSLGELAEAGIDSPQLRALLRHFVERRA